MPGPNIRADYEALTRISQAFSQQAEATTRSLQGLSRQLDTLQGGDWIGQGASAFYAEMSGRVLPTLRRLQAALQQGADLTQQIRQQMNVAEDEAARVLRGNGAGAAGAPATGGAPRPVVVAGPNDKAKPGSPAAVQALIDKGDRQGAIAEAIKQYKIDFSAAKGMPKYDATLKGNGNTEKDGTVTISPNAFRSPGWLASALGHEMVHTRQIADRWYTDPQGKAINEIEAYDWEIQHAAENGLTDEEVSDLRKLRRSPYLVLNADNKKLVDSGRYTLPRAH